MKTFLLFLLLTLSVNVHAQLTSNKVHLFAKYSYGKVDSSAFHNYSVSGEYLINRYIGLNYNFDLMFRKDQLRQFHSSIGALAGPPLIAIGVFSAIASSASTSNSEFNLGILGGVLGLIILAAPDGVSFHIPLSYKWDLSPYANVLGVDFIRNRNTNDYYFKYAMSFGVKTTFLTYSNVTLNAFTETRKVAGMGWSIGGGFGIGYAFAPRDREVPLPLIPADSTGI